MTNRQLGHDASRRRVRQLHGCASGVVIGLLGMLLAGCNQGPFGSAQARGWGNPAQQQAMMSQMNDASRRVSSLDADNTSLHAELAKSQQQVQLLNEHIQQLSRQLADTANQLKSEQLAKQEVERRVDAIQASTRHRGGATIKANSSLDAALEIASISGVEVRRDNDVIRMELPADRLFVQGSAQLQSSAPYLLDQVADAIARNYSRQLIGIEGHTDSGAAEAAAFQQLGAAQALAVFTTLTTRNRLPAGQLFTVSHGANHPLVSNATAAGRAKNRRIEIVVYPETVNPR